MPMLPRACSRTCPTGACHERAALPPLWQGEMFRPVHRDRQMDTWLCQHCDDPSRYREVETLEPAEPVEARREAVP